MNKEIKCQATCRNGEYSSFQNKHVCRVHKINDDQIEVINKIDFGRYFRIWQKLF